MADAFLDADQIRAATFVRHVEIHDTLGSTNDRAKELAGQENIELPALIVARHQTAGRGRGQNIWWSADGSLTFSVLLEPAAIGISSANWPQLSLATAVAICDALQVEAPRADLGIKWPNDVLMDGGKVCGILIESPGGAAPAIHRLVIGIGVNVNNSLRDEHSVVGSGGTAMFDRTGRRCNLAEVLAGMLRALENRLMHLAENDRALPKKWQQLSWLTEQSIVVKTHYSSIDGRCIGVGDDGALLVKTRRSIERIYSGSVHLSP